tara:strand:- start:365 stop:1228 length:864 start_codon:yes stop_codon:yes gene_type:complete
MKTITITFGDQVENHNKNQLVGEMEDIGNGFNIEDIEKCIETIKNKCETELIDLNKEGLENCGYEKEEEKIQKAYLLIIRNGVDYLLNINTKETKDNLFEEQDKLNTDKKALMYGRVVNKLARHNLCFADFEQSANYIKGEGTIIDFKNENINLTNTLRNNMGYLFNENGIYKKVEKLLAEGNYYYDIKKCGIGFHGDAERRKVLGVRLGETLPLVYLWHIRNRPIGRQINIKLNHGDIYIMSEKAVGTDWKSSSKLTLRHAAGCDKYLKTKYDIIEKQPNLNNKNI